MATYLTFHLVRGAANRLFVFSNQHSSLSESVLTSFGMFGLAANGMCPTLLAGTTPLQRGSKLSAGNGVTQ